MEQHKHVGVYALTINDDCVLLIKKARGPYVGKWDLPGGGLEFGENALEGLSREVFEETGLTIQEKKLIGVLSHTVVYKTVTNEEKEMYHLGIIYKTTLDLSKNLKTDTDGQDSGGASWKKISQLNINELSPFAHQSILKFL
jgi:8-oxo-dGTP diphosphatase